MAASLGYDLAEDEITWVLAEVKRRSEAKCAVTSELLHEILCAAREGGRQ